MPAYQTTDPPDPVTEELIEAVLEDARQHLELRLAAITRDFDDRIRQTHEYIMNRTRERVRELILKGEALDLRRKKRQPVIPDWRVEGGEYPPDDPNRFRKQNAA